MKNFIALISGDTIDDMETNLLEAWKQYRRDLDAHESSAIEGVIGHAGISGGYEYQSTTKEYMASFFEKDPASSSSPNL